MNFLKMKRLVEKEQLVCVLNIERKVQFNLVQRGPLT